MQERAVARSAHLTDAELGSAIRSLLKSAAFERGHIEYEVLVCASFAVTAAVERHEFGLLCARKQSPLERAIAAAGGVGALAARVGAAASGPSMWKARGRVPAEYCPAIERETGVKCEDLRPDVAWDVLRLQAGGQAEPASAGVASEASTAGQA